MKRLFYVTNDLDDAEQIANEVRNMGVEDDNVFVVCRDERGIDSHDLHGNGHVENTEIVNGTRNAPKALLYSAIAVFVILFFVDRLFISTNLAPVIIAGIVATMILAIIHPATRAFDDYLVDVLNEHLDSGEVLIVVDVERQSAVDVMHQMEKHPKASMIADGTSYLGPIPAH